jgi:hypothetical protein
VNSWDLFKTLCHARNGNAGEAPIEEHYRITENVAKVQPDDIIVTEYHTPDKAAKIVREVCCLGNQVIVTEDGKTTGMIWHELNWSGSLLTPRVFPTHHTGDNLHCDVEMPRTFGIQTTQVTQHEYTPTEREFINNGNVALANVMREARLTTWDEDPVLRGLQLHQIERNFPFLLKVAYKVKQYAEEHGMNRLLLCSRDCWMLWELMTWLFPNLQVEYFYNSRVTRYRPSQAYIDYATGMIGNNPSKTLIVDMTGSGNSLKYFTDKFGGNPVLVVSHMHNVPSLVHGGIRETSNPAPHDTVVDLPATAPEELSHRLMVMMEAFWECRNAGFNLQEPTYSLDWALRRMEDPRIACLWEDHLSDSKATYELLNSGSLPHEVIL